jgi:hypothetical protein
MAMDRTVSVATLTDKRGDACKRVGIFVFAAGWFPRQLSYWTHCSLSAVMVQSSARARCVCTGFRSRASYANMTGKPDTKSFIVLTYLLRRPFCVWLCEEAAAYAPGEPHGR